MVVSAFSRDSFFFAVPAVHARTIFDFRFARKKNLQVFFLHAKPSPRRLGLQSAVSVARSDFKGSCA
jgi:hypothetical protein